MTSPMTSSKRPRVVHTAAVLLVLALVVAGCTGDDVGDETVELGPAEGGRPTTHTIVRELPTRGDDLTWSWEASGPVTFMVEGPEGDIVQFKESATSDIGNLEVGTLGEYRLQWINADNETVDLKYRVQKDPVAPGAHMGTTVMALGAVAIAMILRTHIATGHESGRRVR